MSQAQYTDQIVRLIEQQGQNAAAAAERRGQIWGGTLASLGQIPAQMQQAERLKQQQQLQQQEIALKNQQIGLETARTGIEVDKARSAQADTATIDKLLGDPSLYDPTTHLLRRDALDQMPVPGHLRPKINGIADDLEESYNKIQTQKQAIDNAHREAVGSAALKVEAADNDPDALRLALTGLVGTGSLDKAQAEAWQAMGSTPDGAKRVTKLMKAGTKAGESDLLIVPPDSNVLDKRTNAPLAGFTPTANPLRAAQIDEAKARIPLIKAQTAKAEAEAAQAKELSGIGGNAGQFPEVAPGQKNDAYLQSLSPGIQTQVKMLSEGKLNVPAFALRTPYWQGLLQATAKYDPSFDTVNFNARNKTRADFTSGPSAKQVNAINTVIGHLDSLSQATDALNNTNYPLINSIANRISKAIGHTSVTNFDGIKKAVSDEVTRVWRQTGGSEQDIQAAQKNLDAANSPAQLHEMIATYGDLLESKLSSLNNQYKQGMGTDKIDIITPQARATLNKLEAKAGRAKGTMTADLPSATASAATTSTGETMRQEIPGHPGQFAESTDGGKTWKVAK